MSLIVAIQMDPIDSIDISADSTFVMALEAQARGHSLYHYLTQDLALKNGRVMAGARHLEAGQKPQKRGLAAAALAHDTQSSA